MPRTSISKCRDQTVIHGFVIVNGEAVPTSVTLEGKRTLAQALRAVRKNNPSFSGDTITRIETVYTMSHSDFYEVAQISEVKEYNE